MEATITKKSNSLSRVLDSKYNTILIYRTNISSQKKTKLLKPFFDENPHILDWNVDRQDVDNILRIEISDGIEEVEILNYIENLGLYCEELED